MEIKFPPTRFKHSVQKMSEAYVCLHKINYPVRFVQTSLINLSFPTALFSISMNNTSQYFVTVLERKNKDQ